MEQLCIFENSFDIKTREHLGESIWLFLLYRFEVLNVMADISVLGKVLQGLFVANGVVNG